MDNILPELLEEICNFLPCKSIILLLSSSNIFNKIIHDNDIINIYKYRGFPRSEGHCLDHEIISSNYKVDWDVLDCDPDNKHDKTIELNKLLDFLIEENFDLVRGDFIWYDDYQSYYHQYFIFDGCEIIPRNCCEIECARKAIILPQEFTVINDSKMKIYNIPIDYYDPRNDHIICPDAIKRNRNIWVDITDDIRKQLIDNIRDDFEVKMEFQIPQFNRIMYYTYTQFTINDNKFYILDIDSCKNIDKHEDNIELIQILTTQNKLLLEYQDKNDTYKIQKDGRYDNIFFIENHIYQKVGDKYILLPDNIQI